MFRKKSRLGSLDRMMVFVTGSPRSGTSLLTKVLDTHRDMAMLMENNFGNRRRHWIKSRVWRSDITLARAAGEAYAGISKPVVGNKICTPDVWWSEDILQFCRLFAEFKIVFIARNPADVVKSRFFREDYGNQFNETARRNIMLDFKSQFHTYTSSWRQSIEVYRQLRDAVSSDIFCVYYEDLVTDLEGQCRKLTGFLKLPFDREMLNWHEVAHHDSTGRLKRNVKYADTPVTSHVRRNEDIPSMRKGEFMDAMSTIEHDMNLYRLRAL